MFKLQLLFCVIAMVWQHKCKNSYYCINVRVAFGGMLSQLSFSICVFPATWKAIMLF